jgi:hypothetical protein
MRWADRVRRLFQANPRVRRQRPSLQFLEDRAVPSVTEPGLNQNATPQPPLPQASGQLWRDLNANGLRDAGEPGIPFVNLQLFQGTTLVGTTSTDYLGNYRFNLWNVSNGTADATDDGLKFNTAYEIRIAGNQPALANLAPTIAGHSSANEWRDSDITKTAKGAFLDFTTTNSEVYLNLDGGYARAGSIGDLVWMDLNNNGRKDANESGIGGVTVRLLDESGTTQIAMTTTAVDGSYLFNGLMPGSYVVEIAASNFAAGSPLAGYASSTGKPGQVTVVDVLDPNVVSTNGMDHGFVVNGAVQSLAVDVGSDANGSNAVDFGFLRSSQISGRVYVDVNADGTIDQEDTASLANVRVSAAGPAGKFSASTDSIGRYQFANLPAGTYTVTLIPQPAGYKPSTPNLITAALPTGGSATVNFGEARTVDLKLTQAASRSVVGKGGNLELTYRIKNLGTMDATDVTFAAALPAAFKILSVDAGGASYNTATQAASIGTLAAGAEVVIKLRVHLLRAGSYRLRADVTANESEDNLANNQSIVRISPPPAKSAKVGGANWLFGSGY